LEKLRRDYDARQAQLADLTRRKEELQAQLRKVEGDIQAIAQGKSARATNGPQRPAPPKTKPATLPKLPHFLMDLIREAGQPMTVKQLAMEVVRRKFPTQSGNIRRLVQARVFELVRKGPCGGRGLPHDPVTP
jgi:hypothetical protein